MQETWVRSLGWEDPLKKEMATHSSILAWRIMDRGAWWATVQEITESDVTEATEHACYEWPSGFRYFLQFKPESGNKEFMIWAKVSSWVWPVKLYFAKALYAMLAGFSLTFETLIAPYVWLLPTQKFRNRAMWNNLRLWHFKHESNVWRSSISKASQMWYCALKLYCILWRYFIQKCLILFSLLK